MIIAGNLHPGSPQCARQWSQRYNTLIGAFQDVVRLQLFGGAETEHFEVIRDLDSGNPVSVVTTSADFSPFRKDPSARLLKVDKLSNYPIEISTASISAAQVTSMQDASSEITVEYKLKYPTDFVGMQDLSPS